MPLILLRSTDEGAHGSRATSTPALVPETGLDRLLKMTPTEVIAAYPATLALSAMIFWPYHEAIIAPRRFRLRPVLPCRAADAGSDHCQQPWRPPCSRRRVHAGTCLENMHRPGLRRRRVRVRRAAATGPCAAAPRPGHAGTPDRSPARCGASSRSASGFHIPGSPAPMSEDASCAARSATSLSRSPAAGDIRYECRAGCHWRRHPRRTAAHRGRAHRSPSTRGGAADGPAWSGRRDRSTPPWRTAWPPGPRVRVSCPARRSR
jgi:hypothetical protein